MHLPIGYLSLRCASKNGKPKDIMEVKLASQGHRNDNASSTALSSPELLDLDPLQAFDTGPNCFTDLDRQFAAFESLVDEPQAYHKLFSVE